MRAGQVGHKRTFFFLEQLILKHRAHVKTSSIGSQPDGMDFFFSERNQAVRFLDFLKNVVPVRYEIWRYLFARFGGRAYVDRLRFNVNLITLCRFKASKKLIGADNHSNTFNFKFTYFVEIAMPCKDDLVCIPRSLAAAEGNVSPLLLVWRVSQSLHLVDPLTMMRCARRWARLVGC